MPRRHGHALRTALALTCLTSALSAAPSAEAATTITAPDPVLFQRWTETSLAPTPPGEVTVSVDVLPWARFPREIHFYDPALLDDAGAERGTFLHELGHVFDFTVMTARERRRFARITNVPGYDREQFAMGYSFCALGVPDPPTPEYWGYEYDVSPAVQGRVCKLIRSAVSNKQK